MLWYGLILTLSLSRPTVSDDRLEASVSRLGAQMHKFFMEQSRFDLIEKGFSNHLQGKIESHLLDLNSTALKSTQKVQKFIDAKIKALKNLVVAGEETAKTFVFDHKRVPDYVSTKYLPHTETIVNTEQVYRNACLEYEREMWKLSVYNTTTDNNLTYAANHEHVESYKCDNAFLRDFEWFNSQDLEDAFLANQAADPTLVRQYIGTYTGLTKVLPAPKWQKEPEEVTMDLFDPRYRPWFITAETAPKDVVFLIDYSGSVKGQTLHLTKITIQHVLTTLDPYDYFTAIWYNAKRAFVMECNVQTFIPATTRNKRLLLTMLDKIEEKDIANLPPALNMTFDLYSNDLIDIGDLNDSVKATLGDFDGSGGHKVILLFTDGIENSPTAVIQEHMIDNPEHLIRIFGFSMGYGTGVMPALDYTTCMMRGSYAIVDSIMDVRLTSKSYMTQLSEILALAYADKPVDKRPVTFATPYMDAQRRGATISLSMPILNTMINGTNNFLAIAGVDATFMQLREMLPHSKHLYAFIIDKNGIVFFHPKLKTPKREIFSVRRTACYKVNVFHRHGTRVPYGITDERVLKMLGLIDSIATTDIAELEPKSALFTKFRRQMIDGICGETIDDGARSYKCSLIAGTPLAIGYVLDKRYSEVTMGPPSPGIQPVLTYTPHDMVEYLIADNTLCHEELSANNSNERFEPFIYGRYKTCPKTAEKYLPFAFIRSVLEWHRSWPALEDNATCETTALPHKMYAKYFISTFVQFFQGITAVYPKCNWKYAFEMTNNADRFPSLQPQVDPKKIYVEHEPLQGSVVLSKVILDTKYGTRLGTVGVQWHYDYLADFFANVTRDDPSWKACKNAGPTTRCLLVSNSLFVLGSAPTSAAVGKHLADTESRVLAELVKRKLASMELILDFQASCQMQHRGKPIYSAAPGVTPVRKLLQRIFDAVWSLLAFDFLGAIKTVLARPVFVSGICRFEKSDQKEQCVMQFAKYNLDTAGKSVLLHLGNANSTCKGTVSITPFKDIEMAVLIIDAGCPASEAEANPLPYGPIRVPDCSFTTQHYRRRRTDLDYTRYHTGETVRECPSETASMAPPSTSLPSALLLCAIGWLLQ
uniref:VWFA domain-containing protein n=1 Tax=Panagrellus redivivus TaxID=6233 RepID=A0A7E4VW18_PANRE